MSGGWISASEALELVSPGCKFNGQATEGIRRYAAAGLVSAKAKVFTVEGRGKKQQLREHSISKGFWELPLEKEEWWHGVFLGVEKSSSWEIRCEALGVSFERKGIEAMLPASLPNVSMPAKKQGRPQGAGGYAAKDKVLVEKMREYIIDHEGTSPHLAAGRFTDQADGGGSLEAKRKRLAARYRKAYPT